MTQFVKNVNTYLSEMKIKQSFVSLKAGIENRKLSRILNGNQDITSVDMEKIAGALGFRAEYFMAEKFNVVKDVNYPMNEVALYIGEPTKEQEAFAMELIDLLENVDEVLGAESRFLEAILG